MGDYLARSLKSRFEEFKKRKPTWGTKDRPYKPDTGYTNYGAAKSDKGTAWKRPCITEGALAGCRWMEEHEANNVNVGTATASSTYAGDANHEGSANASSFTIGAATASVTVTCPAAPQPYTGSAQTPVRLSARATAFIKTT